MAKTKEEILGVIGESKAFMNSEVVTPISAMNAMQEYADQCTSQLREELTYAELEGKRLSKVATELREELEAAKKEIEEIKNIVEKEPVAFLLSNALRLPKERLEALTEALIERTDCGTNLKKEIERLKVLVEHEYRTALTENLMMGGETKEDADLSVLISWAKFKSEHNL